MNTWAAAYASDGVDSPSWVGPVFVAVNGLAIVLALMMLVGVKQDSIVHRGVPRAVGILALAPLLVSWVYSLACAAGIGSNIDLMWNLCFLTAIPWLAMTAVEIVKTRSPDRSVHLCIG